VTNASRGRLHYRTLAKLQHSKQNIVCEFSEQITEALLIVREDLLVEADDATYRTHLKHSVGGLVGFTIGEVIIAKRSLPLRLVRLTSSDVLSNLYASRIRAKYKVALPI